jgi:hypothetical protein
MSSLFDIFSDKEFTKSVSNFDKLFTNKKSKQTSNFSDRLVDQAINQAIASGKTKDKKINDKDDIKNNSIDGIFEAFTVSEERLSRYKVYDELYSSVQLIKRIVKIYLNNILQRDTVSNETLSIHATEEATDAGHEPEYRSFCKSFIEFFQLEDRIPKAILNVLKYGDTFIEVIDLEDIDIKKTISDQQNKKTNDLLFEQKVFDQIFKSTNDYYKFNQTDLNVLIDNIVDFDFIDISESKNINKLETQFSSPYGLSQVILKFHKPANIVIINTEYDNVLGYVEIREDKQSKNPITSKSSNNLVTFAQIINQVANSSMIIAKDNEAKQQKAIELFVDTIVAKLLKKHNIEDYSNQVKSKIGEELFYVVQRLYINASNDTIFQNKLKIRYISPSNMCHIKVPTGDFHPYGTSIIDGLIFPGKLYLLAQLSNAVNKLSRSSVLRKWTIETGDRDNINSLVQRLSKQIRNEQVTARDIATTKNIGNILSDYKDVMAFRKRGQDFINVETMQTGDPNIRVQDIEDLRRELIALSGIPSTYLGYNDMDMREQLVNANIVFADDISTIQKQVNDGLTRLAARVSEIVNFKPNHEFKKNVRISTKPPTALMLQIIETSLNSISSFQRIFNEMPEIELDPYYFLKRFIPFIDWYQFEKESNDFKQRKQVSKEAGIPDPNQMGGFGGSGGY